MNRIEVFGTIVLGPVDTGLGEEFLVRLGSSRYGIIVPVPAAMLKEAGIDWETEEGRVSFGAEVTPPWAASDPEPSNFRPLGPVNNQE